MENEKAKSTIKWNTSVMIALVAVLISCASAIIGWYEARLMKDQQEVLLAQKEASVWPYLDMYTDISYDLEKDYFIYSLRIQNKGIGPAIIGDVTYLLEGDTVETWSIVRT